MLDIKYLQEMNDNLNQFVFNDTILVDVKINIMGKPVNSEVNLANIYDSLDSKVDEQVKYDYNIDMKPSYTVKVFVVDQSGLALSSSNAYVYKPVGFTDSYSVWISCRLKDVELRDKSYFDYAKNVEMGDSKYVVKGILKDSFGKDVVLHVFLGKEG